MAYRFLNEADPSVWFQLTRHHDPESGQYTIFSIEVHCESAASIPSMADDYYLIEFQLANLLPPYNPEFMAGVIGEFAAAFDQHHEATPAINRRNLVYMITYQAGTMILEATTASSPTIGFIDQLIWNCVEDQLAWLPPVPSDIEGVAIYHYRAVDGELELHIGTRYYRTPKWLERDQSITLN